MKAKLIINDKELEVEISEEELKKLETKPIKKTGYERVIHQPYYIEQIDGTVYEDYDDGCDADDIAYDGADYYSDYTVAENNARADKLIRQLRRFAVEHREDDLHRADSNTVKYVIKYDAYNHRFLEGAWTTISSAGAIYFDSEKTAQLAIDAFRDELIWYFTEYKDSL